MSAGLSPSRFGRLHEWDFFSAAHEQQNRDELQLEQRITLDRATSISQNPSGGKSSTSTHHGVQIARPSSTSMSQGGMSTTAAEPQRGWPKAIYILELQLVVHIHHHEVPGETTSCWTYISEGLSRVNQPEVVFSLLRRKEEFTGNFPESPIEWIRIVHELAKGGTNLETGQMCDLVFDTGAVQIKLNQRTFPQETRKWDTFQRFGALVHGIPISDPRFGIPDDALPSISHHVIALTREEAAVARQFGVTRVIGHVGQSVRWFPHPPWINRDRATSLTMADQVGTIRSKVPVTRIYGISVMLVDNEIIFTIPEGEAKRSHFRKYVQNTPANDVMAFESFMTADADGGLCWKRNQQANGYGAHKYISNSPTN